MDSVGVGYNNNQWKGRKFRAIKWTTQVGIVGKDSFIAEESESKSAGKIVQWCLSACFHHVGIDQRLEP